MNVSVRGGTNQYHGSAWEFLRNTELNATGFIKLLLNRRLFVGIELPDGEA